MVDKDYVGVNYMTKEPYAFVGKLHWNIKSHSYTEKINDKLISFNKDFQEQAKKAKSNDDLIVLKRKSAKQVLELTLEKFSWSKPANDPNCGPYLLTELAGEVKDFCIGGGKVGRQRLRMRLDTITRTS